MMAAQAIAVLDLDGTLFPGIAGIEFAVFLAERGLASSRHVHEIEAVAARHAHGKIDLAPATALVYAHYAKSLRGKEQSNVQRAADEYWSAARDRLFPFSRHLVARLGRLGLCTALVSGSPQEIVHAAAQDLGIPRAAGAVLGTYAGRYTGELLSAPGTRPGKSETLAELTRDLDAACVFCIGNSAADADLFQHATFSVAFEPDPQLADMAQTHGWLVADRDSVTAAFDAISTDLAALSAVGGIPRGDR
jgi:phosphoserine phosphatase